MYSCWCRVSHGAEIVFAPWPKKKHTMPWGENTQNNHKEHTIDRSKLNGFVIQMEHGAVKQKKIYNKFWVNDCDSCPEITLLFLR